MESQTFVNYLYDSPQDPKDMKPEDWVNSIYHFLNRPAPVFTNLYEIIYLMGPSISSILMKKTEYHDRWKSIYPTDHSRAMDLLGSWLSLENPSLWSYLNGGSLTNFVAVTLVNEEEFKLGFSKNCWSNVEKRLVRDEIIKNKMNLDVFETNLIKWKTIFSDNKKQTLFEQVKIVDFGEFKPKVDEAPPMKIFMDEDDADENFDDDLEDDGDFDDFKDLEI